MTGAATQRCLKWAARCVAAPKGCHYIEVLKISGAATQRGLKWAGQPRSAARLKMTGAATQRGLKWPARCVAARKGLSSYRGSPLYINDHLPSSHHHNRNMHENRAQSARAPPCSPPNGNVLKCFRV